MAGVTLTGSTLAAGASVGKTSIASCGPTPGVAPARAALRAAEAPHNFLNFDLVAEAYSSPPHGVAADCAIQRVAKARPTARPNPRPNYRRFVLGAPPPRRYCVAATEDGDSLRNRATRSQPIVVRHQGRNRACENCSPPRGVAANCAAQRAAEARPKARPNSLPKSQSHIRPSAVRKP